MENKILHFGREDIFTSALKKFIDSKFISHKNQFITPDLQGSIFSKIKRSFSTIFALREADVVVFHSFIFLESMLLVFLSPLRPKKMYWFVYGHELYDFIPPYNSWRKILHHFIKVQLIRKVDYVVAYMENDYKLARKWYGTTAKQFPCIKYPSNIFRPSSGNKTEESINVLVGYSASDALNYDELIEKVRPFSSYPAKFYFILSYGDQKIISEVMKMGREVLGDKFYPVLNFMPLQDYDALISTMDVVIMTHNRQKAMGTLIQLLGNGAKVYLPAGLSHSLFFKKIGVRIFNPDEFNLEKISIEDAQNNRKIITTYFSEERLQEQLKFIMEG